jgi:hypothetical protein
MKSEIIEEIVKEQPPEEYPCLKEYNNNSGSGNFIVLFTSCISGTVVHSNNALRPVGEYSINWSCEFNKTNKKIILSND